MARFGEQLDLERLLELGQPRFQKLGLIHRSIGVFFSVKNEHRTGEMLHGKEGRALAQRRFGKTSFILQVEQNTLIFELAVSARQVLDPRRQNAGAQSVVSHGQCCRADRASRITVHADPSGIDVAFRAKPV